MQRPVCSAVCYFDSRQKSWYQTAKQTRNSVWTKAYIGAVEPILGISISAPVIGPSGEFVGAYGLDLILTRLSDFMSRQRLGNTGRCCRFGRLRKQQPLIEQAGIAQLLQPARIGVELSETFQWHPEQSTSAIIAHHPEARYFVIR